MDKKLNKKNPGDIYDEQVQKPTAGTIDNTDIDIEKIKEKKGIKYKVKHRYLIFYTVIFAIIALFIGVMVGYTDSTHYIISEFKI